VGFAFEAEQESWSAPRKPEMIDSLLRLLPGRRENPHSKDRQRTDELILRRTARNEFLARLLHSLRRPWLNGPSLHAFLLLSASDALTSCRRVDKNAHFLRQAVNFASRNGRSANSPL